MPSPVALSGALVFVLLACSGLETPGLASLQERSTSAACDGPWRATGSMSTPRYLATATRLADGKVLVVGGRGDSDLSSAEVYAPGTGTWSAAGGMSIERYWHRAVLLQDGRVLVTGGYPILGLTTSAEIYDPSTNAWHPAASMSTPRYAHHLTVLTDGRVLAFGGINDWYGTADGSAEVYDPLLDAWHPVGAMSNPRFKGVATTLHDGRVLVAGGAHWDNLHSALISLQSAEIFDPSTETWTTVHPMSVQRLLPGMALLPDGRVLVAGGDTGAGFTASAEIFDPASDTWSLVGSMSQPRFNFETAPLAGGRVLIAGGYDGVKYPAGAEVFDATANLWTPIPSMSTSRYMGTLMALLDGRVLAAGGVGESGFITNTAEIHAPCDLNQPPVAACASRVVSAGPTCTAAASVDDGSHDPDNGPQPLVIAQAPAGPYGLGSRTVTLTAGDGAATDSCAAEVTVVDDTPPQVTCPGPQVLECQGGSATATFTAEVADNCGAGAASCPLSGQPLPPGDTTVTCTATDGSQNRSSCSFVATVRDSRPPVPGASRGMVLWPPNHELLHVSLSDCAEDAADACSGPLSLNDHGFVTHVTSDEGDGHTTGDVSIDGPSSISLRAERDGHQDGRVYAVHYLVTDPAGNATAASCTVSVPHDRSGPPAVDSGPQLCVGPGC